MKVAIDIRRARDFGAGTYTRNLVATLARLDPESSYRLVGARDDFSEFGALPENFSLLEFEGGGAWGELQLGWRLKNEGVSLLHSPYLAAPWAMPCRHLITVHDTVEFLEPPADGAPVSRLFRLYRTQRSLHRACCVLTVSHATRRELQKLFAVPGEKIKVVYNALDARLAEAPSTEEIERTLNRYSIQGPYLLYAGNVKPHKNLPRLIEAFALVKDQLRQQARFVNLKLIIIGDELSQHPELRRAVIKSRTEHDVRFLGFVAPETLKVFYASAAVFVFPSLHEGFGLPPLEAMAMGTPVVTSNTSALPEVLGSAAHFVNPENVFDISRGIRQVLLDTELRHSLVELGRKQVGRFSWDDSVAQVLAIYRQHAA